MQRPLTARLGTTFKPPGSAPATPFRFQRCGLCGGGELSPGCNPGEATSGEAAGDAGSGGTLDSARSGSADGAARASCAGSGSKGTLSGASDFRELERPAVASFV